MARQPIPLEQRGASAMYTTRGERRPAGTVHYAVNMFPASVKNPNSPWVTRGAFVNIGSGTAAGSAVVGLKLEVSEKTTLDLAYNALKSTGSSAKNYYRVLIRTLF